MLGHKYKVLTMWPRGPASLGQVLRWPNLVGHETKVAHEAGPQIQGFDHVGSWPRRFNRTHCVHLKRSFIGILLIYLFFITVKYLFIYFLDF